jgi:hypothetical protein
MSHAQIVAYYGEYSESMELVCPCGWTGPARDAPMEMHNDLFDRSCPECDTMLLIVPYPTTAQTLAAAAAGNEEAAANALAYGMKLTLHPD